MTEKILLVDDEPEILNSMRRQLRKRYTVLTAESGDEALEVVAGVEDIAVIVSDMRMPGMDGVQLLKRVKDIAPDTVRIMLTGNADQETAAEAVNTGHIFRFLTKPCSTAIMVTSLALAVRHYNLVTAEKELLNKTVKGSIAVMAELLSLANSIAFSSGYRIKPVVKQIGQELKVTNLWQYEVAALMSQIGCITLPNEVLFKLQQGEKLSEEELQMYQNHPKVGSRLIRKIPRMEKVALMIEKQLTPYDALYDSPALDEDVAFGASVLKILIDYDLLRQQDYGHLKAVGLMKKRAGSYNDEILKTLVHIKPKGVREVVENLKFKDVIPGMVAVEDVFAKNGTMLIPRNQVITWHIIQSLTNFEKHIGITEPIKVRIAENDEPS